MKLRLFRLMLCTHEGSTNICTRTDLFRFFHAKFIINDITGKTTGRLAFLVLFCFAFFIGKVPRLINLPEMTTRLSLLLKWNSGN